MNSRPSGERPEGQGTGPGPSEPEARVVLRTLAAVAAAVGIVWAAVLARQVLLISYVSGLLAIGINPLVRRIERQHLPVIGAHRLPRWFVVAVVYAAMLCVLAGISFLVLPVLVKQVQQLTTQLPTMFEDAQAYLIRHHIVARHVTIEDVIRQAPSAATLFGTVVFTFENLLGGMFGLFSIGVLSFFFLVEANSLFDGFVHLFPKERRPEISALSDDIATAVSAWLEGQLMLAVIIGVTSSVGLGLLGIPYFYVLAIVAAAGEFIPYFGPVFAALPGIGIALTISWKLAIGVALFYLVQQQIESDVLVPRIMAHQVDLSGSGILVAMLIGGSLLGIVGATLAIPTVAIVQVIFQKTIGEER